MITPLRSTDVDHGFRSGSRPLDESFARHALPNDRAGISRCFVLRQDAPGSPIVCGFYTLSMASIQTDAVRASLKGRLPRYALPVALIGRLAVDERARGRGFGEALLIDAIMRVVGIGDGVGCVGIIVDAKDERAEGFYARYDFVTVESEVWPRRMFLPMVTARSARRPA